MEQDIESILYTEDQIRSGTDRVAREITEAFTGMEFTVVSILKGSCIFASDLIRRIPIPLELAFCAASSYRDGTESGKLSVNFQPEEQEIQGRNLLLVDDILDTGRTMAALKRIFLERGAAQVRTCVFLDKPSRRSVEMDVDFRAFEVEDRFVVGYGLDYAGRYRNLPYVGALRSSVYSAPSEAK
jgi:hypoxanthine phosphoribosyltransferase